MKIMHLADLHIGKIVNGFSMLEDQIYIMEQIVSEIKKNDVEVVLISGDVYDKASPSVEAVKAFNQILTMISFQNVYIMIVSGNHDSAERLSFAREILAEHKIYISESYNGTVQKVCLKDEYGDINFHLLPFIKPSMVKPFHPEKEITDYNNAFAAVMSLMENDINKRNILISHQFFSGVGDAVLSDSEISPVGGLDNIDYNLVSNFDYVALGHLHAPQKVGMDHIRYAGSPLKYSFSEHNHKKKITIVDLKEKGNTEIIHIPLNPRLDLRKIKGNLDAILGLGLGLGLGEDNTEQNKMDYLHITLTDSNEVYDAIGRIRAVYPNVMTVEFANEFTYDYIQTEASVEENTPLEIFENFFAEQNGYVLSDKQKEIIIDIMNSDDFAYEQGGCA